MMEIENYSNKKKNSKDSARVIKKNDKYTITIIERIKYCEITQKFKIKKNIFDQEKITEFKTILSTMEKKLPKLSNIPSTTTFVLIFSFSTILIIITNTLLENLTVKILVSFLIFLLMITIMSQIYQIGVNIKDKRNLILLKMVNEWNVDNSGQFCCHFSKENGGIFMLYQVGELTWRARRIHQKKEIDDVQLSEGGFKNLDNGENFEIENENDRINDEEKGVILCENDINFLKNLGNMRFSEAQLMKSNEKLKRLRELDDELKIELGLGSGKNSKNVSFYEPENFSFDSKNHNPKIENQILEKKGIKPKSNFGNLLNSRRSEKRNLIVNESVIELDSEKEDKKDKEDHENVLKTTIANKTNL